MTPGRLAYLLYFRPLGLARQCVREGGPLEQWRTAAGRAAMERAAPALGRGGIVRSEGDGDTLEVHLLVGRRFWFMAAFALASLREHSGRAVRAHLHDDGSLGEREKGVFAAWGDAVVLHPREEVDRRIELVLPEHRFPFLRERLRNYPNLRKLTHPHLGQTGAKLVLDADVLFFRRPDELIAWHDAPAGLLCATDVEESYGYSRGLMERLCGAPVPPLVNVGITGLRSEDLDWCLLEDWCRELITRENTSYYLEQALVAMLCARAPFTQLPHDRYITGPSDEQVLDGTGVMQHYVDLTKKHYLRSAWRRFAASP